MKSTLPSGYVYRKRKNDGDFEVFRPWDVYPVGWSPYALIVLAREVEGETTKSGMSEEDKIYAFVAFGIESYKQANGLSGAEAAQTFARYGVDEYLRDEYDVLHTLGQRELLDDINRFIEVRK